MKAEKSTLEIMRSCEIVHKLENDDEFRESFFEIADSVQSRYEDICRKYEDISEASDDDVEDFYSLYNYYRRNIRGNIVDAKLEYEYANFRQTRRTMRSKNIDKTMGHKMVGNVLRDKLEDAIDHKEYTLIWEIYGEIYMAHRLGAIRKYQYDKLWTRLYPYITGVRLVPDGERRQPT